VATGGAVSEGNREARPLLNTKTLGVAFASSLAAATATAGITAAPAAAQPTPNDPYCAGTYGVDQGCATWSHVGEGYIHSGGWQYLNHGNWGDASKWYCLQTSNSNGGWTRTCDLFNGSYWSGKNWGGAWRKAHNWNADRTDRETLAAVAPHYTI
jgi:hypothetical protein